MKKSHKPEMKKEIEFIEKPNFSEEDTIIEVDPSKISLNKDITKSPIFETENDNETEVIHFK